MSIITIPGHKIGAFVNTQENIQAHVELSLKKKCNNVCIVLQFAFSHSTFSYGQPLSKYVYVYISHIYI